MSKRISDKSSAKPQSKIGAKIAEIKTAFSVRDVVFTAAIAVAGLCAVGAAYVINAKKVDQMEDDVEEEED